MSSALVVISHYNAWPTDKLISLLDQTREIPAGHPFSIRVVINEAEEKPLELPARHSAVEILRRENTGYNIGAWELGWRHPPKFDSYLFLQEECVIRKSGWLKAFLRVLARPGVGMVGESHAYRFTTWEECSRDPQSAWNRADLRQGDASLEDWTLLARDYLRGQGIDPREFMGHLQSLVLCTSHRVLEAIGGLRIGRNYPEGMAAEVGISKSVEALGLEVCQVNVRPFEYILHPQWEKLRQDSAGLKWWARELKMAYRKHRAKSSRADSPISSPRG